MTYTLSVTCNCWNSFGFRSSQSIF